MKGVVPSFDVLSQQGQLFPEFDKAIYKFYHDHDELRPLLQLLLDNELKFASRLLSSMLLSSCFVDASNSFFFQCSTERPELFLRETLFSTNLIKEFLSVNGSEFLQSILKLVRQFALSSGIHGNVEVLFHLIPLSRIPTAYMSHFSSAGSTEGP